MVFVAIYVDQPDLLPGRVPFVARVEYVGTLTIQLGPVDTTLLGSGQHQPFVRLQIVPVEPVGLDLLSALGVEVGGVDEPAAVFMQLAAPEVVVRSRRGERLHNPWIGEPDQEEPDALVPVVVLRYEDRVTVRSPGDDHCVPFYGLGETEGRLRAVGGCCEHVGSGPEARPAPRHPFSVGRDARPEERRDGEQGFEPEVSGHDWLERRRGVDVDGLDGLFAGPPAMRGGGGEIECVSRRDLERTMIL